MQRPQPGNDIRSRFWLWSHYTGAYNHAWGLPGSSDYTPLEAALYTGIPNVSMVVYHDQPQPPFDSLAEKFSVLPRAAWSIVGDGGSKKSDWDGVFNAVLDVGRHYPNIVAGVMDDFLDWENKSKPRIPLERIREYRKTLHAIGMELWIVLYEHQLDVEWVPEFLAECDCVSFWTWKHENLDKLQENIACVRQLAPSQKLIQGLYFWDFNGKPMPIGYMEKQCKQAKQWLLDGTITEAMMASSTVIGMPLDTIGWFREWLRKNGDLRIESDAGSAKHGIAD